MVKMEIISNKIQCKHCNDLIESRHVHEYKKCSCGKVAVDGGLEYLKREFPEFPTENHYIELSCYIDDDGKKIDYANGK